MTVLGRGRTDRRRKQARAPARAGVLSQHLRFGLPVRLWIGLLVLSALVPILELINIAFKSAEAFQEHPLGLGGLTLANISAAWTQGDYLRGYLISGFIGVSVAIVVTLTASCAAYALVFLKFRGKEIIFGWYLLSMALPLAMFLVPLFFAYRKLGIMNTDEGLILLYCGIFGPFSTLLFRSFYTSIPTSLRESAQIDGAGEWRIWASIFLPLARPMFNTVAALVAIWSWNEFFFANAFIQSGTKQPVALRYLVFAGNYAGNWPAIMAAGLIALLPIALLYFIAQRRIVEGLVTGAVR
jgi:raffinose/stachyose/melibiose transport system permease protein